MTPPPADSPATIAPAGNAPAAGSVLYIDPSALLRRHLGDQRRPLVLDAMAGAEHWVCSALGRAELEVALNGAAVTPTAQRALWAAVRDDWEALWEVPVDGRCLSAAAGIAARFGLGLSDAIHVAAASRLPRGSGFCTFSFAQISAAGAQGLKIISG